MEHAVCSLFEIIAPFSPYVR